MRSRNKQNIYLPLQKTHGHKLGKALTYPDRFPPLKPHNPLTTWPLWGHLTIWKIYISTFTKLMATERDTVQYATAYIVTNFLLNKTITRPVFLCLIMCLLTHFVVLLWFYMFIPFVACVLCDSVVSFKFDRHLQ